jgi:hypothetical protein
MNDYKISLDELRERVKKIKNEVDELNDLLYRQHFFERSQREIEKADAAKFRTAEFHD